MTELILEKNVMAVMNVKIVSKLFVVIIEWIVGNNVTVENDAIIV